MKRKKHLFFWVAMLCGLCGCVPNNGTSDLPPVGNFEPERYLGIWHEIARLDHRFERGMHAVTAQYSALPDGQIRVVNSGIRNQDARRIEGVARFRGARSEGLLEVSFFRPFYGEYRIVILEKDYSAAAVTSSSRDYLWILSRTPQMPAPLLENYLARLKKMGFLTENLIFPEKKIAKTTSVKYSPSSQK
ncbi:MAG: lipocalin family protein [Victivallaceae bacterium]|nr:lipocalin family protein [Victivallaceae bacterium]